MRSYATYWSFMPCEVPGHARRARVQDNGAPVVALGTADRIALMPSRDLPRAASLRDRALGLWGRNDWGLLPFLAFTCGIGLVLASQAYGLARTGQPNANLYYWAGLLTIYMPTASRLFSTQASGVERYSLLLLLALALYGLRVLRSPVAFTSFDELLHWRTAQDILDSGRLFLPNPLLPVSPYYPGLEIVTTALVNLSGQSTFVAGLLVVGLARVLVISALYLLYWHISGSARLGGVAALLYMSNPNYVSFDSQFAYESLALAFVTGTAYLLYRRGLVAKAGRWGLTVATVGALFATIVSHHISAAVLLLMLATWSLVASARSRYPHAGTNPLDITLTGVAIAAGWVFMVARLTINYLEPAIASGLTELAGLLTGSSTGRTLFQSSTGMVNPLWERVTGFLSVALILLGLPPGLWQLWRRYRFDPAALTLGLACVAYPATLALRFTRYGAELSGRTSPFLFLGIAFVLALVATGAGGRQLSHAPRYLLFVPLVTVLFTGGVIVGRGPSALALPGPYVVAGDSRSIEPQSIAAARWAKIYLGPNNRMAADRTNSLLMGSYGDQFLVNGLTGRINVSSVFFSRTFGPEDVALLRRGNVRYLVVDRRLSTGLPQFGVYFEPGEPGEGKHTKPIDPAALAKFDSLAGVDRIFDSGDIVIYDVGGIVNPR